MKFSKLLFSISILCLSQFVFADDTRVDAKYWSQRYAVIMSTAPTQRVPIYEDILTGNQNPDVEFLDLLAEQYANSNRADKYAAKANTLLFEILVTSNNVQRYLAVLEAGAKPPSSAKLRRKVKRLIRKAKKTESVRQYIAGSIDFEELGKQYGQKALASETDFADSEIPISTLSPNSTIQDMFNNLGTPQHVISGAQRFSDGIISVNIKRMNYYYKGQGRVVFDYKKRKGWLLHSIVIDPIAFEEIMPYRRNPESFNVISDYDLHMAMLLSDGPISIRRVAEIYNGENTSTKIEMLDVAAEKLLTHFRDSEEPAFLDAYAWLCKWLARRGGPRYKAVLETVASNTENSKLLKYATTKIDEQSDVPAELYQPGSVSIAELMKKYPSPYLN